ncbi:hypothetical protein KDK_16560 [Dictyobacter kobayashii]|uniref:3-keto-alpha-glucoside-1,2-lyase/3-keto-2-hydroxy-glucal hydratase domain-containing protein n=2 Tax=Dictyobacter kobayashii TaxID=2014872 RepID=A0A402AFJ3_9CHLR|nr:hypothetical protein KDK_16560 [Dictyobacter kobayashii]
MPVVNKNQAAAPGSGLHPAWSKEPPQTPNNLSQNVAFPKTPTGALTSPEQSSSTGTLKLNDPVKVVKVPVAGQPGRYITGILPFERQSDDAGVPPVAKKGLKPWMRNSIAVAIVVVILALLGTQWISQNLNKQQSQQSTTTAAGNAAANNPALQATATASANILVSDALDKNINGWRTTPTNLYAFKNGAYHVAAQGTTGSGVILPGKSFTGPLTYSLTMQEIKGDDNDPNNTFGMIMRFNRQQKNGKINTTFYSFEVVNVKGKEYQFWRYDDSQPNPWTQVKNGTLPTGNEFHQGKQANTISIAMDGNKFTVTVNGKKLAKVFQDGTYQAGTVGMIVNKDGTEVAFKNLLLTRN